MRTLIWSNTFVRAVKRINKKSPSIITEIEDTLKLLVQNPFSPKLETHKLKGKLKDSWACSAGYDLRIIFDFVKDTDYGEENIFLLEIGTHDDVY